MWLQHTRHPVQGQRAAAQHRHTRTLTRRMARKARAAATAAPNASPIATLCCSGVPEPPPTVLDVDVSGGGPKMNSGCATSTTPMELTAVLTACTQPNGSLYNCPTTPTPTQHRRNYQVGEHRRQAPRAPCTGKGQCQERVGGGYLTTRAKTTTMAGEVKRMTLALACRAQPHGS